MPCQATAWSCLVVPGLALPRLALPGAAIPYSWLLSSALLYLVCFLHDTSSPRSLPLGANFGSTNCGCLDPSLSGLALVLPTHVCNCSHALTFSPLQSVVQWPEYYKAESLPALMTPSFYHAWPVPHCSFFRFPFLSQASVSICLIYFLCVSLPSLWRLQLPLLRPLPLHCSSRAYRHTKPPPQLR